MKKIIESESPVGSIADFYPFLYSGETDPEGMYLGVDVSGTNIIVNFDRREQDKTNGHILILGTSGKGRSYLLNISETEMKNYSGEKYAELLEMKL